MDEFLEFDDEFDVHKRNPIEPPKPPRKPEGLIFNDNDCPKEVKFVSRPKGIPIEASGHLFISGLCWTWDHRVYPRLKDPEFTEPIDFIARGTYKWLIP